MEEWGCLFSHETPETKCIAAWFPCTAAAIRVATGVEAAESEEEAMIAGLCGYLPSGPVAFSDPMAYRWMCIVSVWLAPPAEWRMRGVQAAVCAVVDHYRATSAVRQLDATLYHGLRQRWASYGQTPSMEALPWILEAVCDAPTFPMTRACLERLRDGVLGCDADEWILHRHTLALDAPLPARLRDAYSRPGYRPVVEYMVCLRAMELWGAERALTWMTSTYADGLRASEEASVWRLLALHAPDAIAWMLGQRHAAAYDALLHHLEDCLYAAIATDHVTLWYAVERKAPTLWRERRWLPILMEADAPNILEACLLHMEGREEAFRQAALPHLWSRPYLWTEGRLRMVSILMRAGNGPHVPERGKWAWQLLMQGGWRAAKCVVPNLEEQLARSGRVKTLDVERHPFARSLRIE